MLAPSMFGIFDPGAPDETEEEKAARLKTATFTGGPVAPAFDWTKAGFSPDEAAQLQAAKERGVTPATMAESRQAIANMPTPPSSFTPQTPKPVFNSILSSIFSQDELGDISKLNDKLANNATGTVAQMLFNPDERKTIASFGDKVVANPLNMALNAIFKPDEIGDIKRLAELGSATPQQVSGIPSQIANRLLGLTGFGLGGMGISSPVTPFLEGGSQASAPSNVQQANPAGPYQNSKLPYIPPGAGWGTNAYPTDALFNNRLALNGGGVSPGFLDAMAPADQQRQIFQAQMENARNATELQKANLMAQAAGLKNKASPAEIKEAFGSGNPPTVKKAMQDELERRGDLTPQERKKINVESLFFDNKGQPIQNVTESQLPEILNNAVTQPDVDSIVLYNEMKKRGVNDDMLRKMMINVAMEGQATNLKKLPSGTRFPNELLGTPYARTKEAWNLFNPADVYRSIKAGISGHPEYGILDPQQVQQLDMLSRMYQNIKE